MSIRRISFGSEFETKIGYCRAVVAGGFVHVAGTVGQGATVAEQCRAALDVIGRALDEAGASFADVVRVNYFLPDAGEFEACPGDKPRHVIGVLGPTNRTASLSPDVNRPDFRNVTFHELRQSYAEAALGLVEGGADLLMVETIFDTLNAKAALYAIGDVYAQLGWRLPIMISGTITDASGRTLSGQTVAAFWHSVRHA